MSEESAMQWKPLFQASERLATIGSKIQWLPGHLCARIVAVVEPTGLEMYTLWYDQPADIVYFAKLVGPGK